MWVRLDDAILDNPKIIAVGFRGLALHVAAITWCARNDSRGLLPKVKLGGLLHDLEDPDAVRMRLVAAGLWHDRGDAWELHDFQHYNPAGVSLVQRRLQRQRAGAKRAQTAKRNENGTFSPAHNQRPSSKSNGPVPVPVPVPGEQEDLSEGILPFSTLPAVRRPARRPAVVMAADDQVLLDAWNGHAGTHGLRAVRHLDAERRKKLATLRREYDQTTLLDAIAVAGASAFCRGQATDAAWAIGVVSKRV